MHRRTCFLGLLAAPLASGPSARAATAAPLPVVASFTILANMVREVGGDMVQVTSFVGPDGDPHTYEPRPADLRAIGRARLLVENGLGLEGWMARLFPAGGFKGSRVTAARDVKSRTMAEDGKLTTDPHAWQDPRNGVVYVQAIGAGLSQADAAHAGAYRAAVESYATEIMRTDTWIEQQFAVVPPPARRIITTHDAFGYYGARFGIELLSAEGLSTDAEPSGQGIARLVAQIKREKIRAVFLENMGDPRVSQMLARETGATIGGTVYSDALSGPDGPAPSYLRMLHHNTSLFVAAMKPA